MKKLLISAVLALTLVIVMAVPVMAADEASVGASVSVSEFVSISLTDAGTAGIDFGSLDPGDEDIGEVDQSSGTPAIKVKVEDETNVNVDIAIQKTAAAAEITWSYTKTFTETPTVEIPDTYGTAVYSDVGDGEYDFYHWVTVSDTADAGTYTATVWYKATKH